MLWPLEFVWDASPLDFTVPTPVWDPGEGKNRPTLLSWSDVVRAD